MEEAPDDEMWDRKRQYLEEDALEDEEPKTVEQRLAKLERRVEDLEKYETCFCTLLIIGLVALLLVILL